MRSITHETFANSAPVARVEKTRVRIVRRAHTSARWDSLMLRWAAIGFCAAFWAGVAALIF